MERWRVIPGYPETRCDEMGNFQSCAGRWKTWHDVKPYKKNAAPYYVLHVRDESGKIKEVKAAKLIALAFIGKIPKGYAIVHKDRFQADNSIYNLALCSKKKMGEMTGSMSNRIPVAKVNMNGEIVKLYTSARDAAKHENCSYQTIMDRCNGKVKKPFELFNGHTFKWMKNI